jgi:uncharacterized protein YbjT (DUF2867 family)
LRHPPTHQPRRNWLAYLTEDIARVLLYDEINDDDDRDTTELAGKLKDAILAAILRTALKEGTLTKDQLKSIAEH